MSNLVFNINNALDYLLTDSYFKEFESINGLNQHPDGLRFHDWLLKKQIINQQNWQERDDYLKNLENPDDASDLEELELPD